MPETTYVLGMDKTDNYIMGYRKLPKTRQFKPGHSGNKSGRPKGARNRATLFKEQLLSDPDKITEQFDMSREQRLIAQVLDQEMDKVEKALSTARKL